MKSTGIIRKIDNVGRIVLPIEVRRILDFQTGSEVEFFTEDDYIILKRYSPFCSFCGKTHDGITFCNIKICAACAVEIAEKANHFLHHKNGASR